MSYSMTIYTDSHIFTADNTVDEAFSTDAHGTVWLTAYDIDGEPIIAVPSRRIAGITYGKAVE